MDHNVKKAITVLGAIIGALGIAMLIFYRIQGAKPVENELNVNQKLPEASPVSHSDLEGIFSAEVPLVTEKNRLGYFQVSHREDGTFVAFAHVTSIGDDSAQDIACAEVKIQEPDLYIRCSQDNLGIISLDGKITRDPAIKVSGKVMWTQDSRAILDQSVQMTLSAAGG